MLKVNKFILKYLLYSFPFVIGFCIWFQMTGAITHNPYTSKHLLLSIFYTVLNWNLIIWFILLLYFPFVLIFSSQFRELFLTTSACIKERDERESFITGQSSRFAFLSTLALLIFLLLFNTIQVEFEKYPPQEAINDSRGAISFALNFKLFQLDAIKRTKKDGTVSWTNSFPLTKQGTILLIIFWQVLSYHYFARKKRKVE